MSKKLLSMLLSLSMIFSMLPVSAMAEEAYDPFGSSGEIIAFASLEETAKTVTVGTSVEDLELPEILTATVRSGSTSDSGATEEPAQDSVSPDEDLAAEEDTVVDESMIATTSSAIEAEISEPSDTGEATDLEWEETTQDISVKWTSQPEYDLNVEGEYVFTPVIEGYTVSTELPEVTVTVEEAVEMRMMSATESITVATEVELKEAIAKVVEGGTIVLGEGISLTTTVTIASGNTKSFILDLNGKTLRGYNLNPIEHNGSGTLTIIDNSSGSKGKVTSESRSGSSYRTILLIGGSIEVQDGIVENGYGDSICNTGTGSVSILGGAVKNTGVGYAIRNSYTGTVSISGGSIVSSKAEAAIYNDSIGKITIGDTAKVTSENTDSYSGTIYLKDDISSDTILEITGGTVENTYASGNAIYNSAAGKIVIPSGSPVIKGGGMAMNKAPDLTSYAKVTVTASMTKVDGTETFVITKASIDTDIEIQPYKYLKFEPIPATVPGKIDSMSLTSRDKSLELSWGAPDDGGSPITGYEVSTDNGKTYTSIGIQTFYTVTGLTNGTEYIVKVRAVNAIGAGTPIEFAGTPMGAPSAPTGLTVIPGHKQLDLAWLPPADNGGGSHINYEVSINGGSTYKYTSYNGITLKELTNGTSYTIKVRAYNEVGYGPESEGITGTPVAATLNGTVAITGVTQYDQTLTATYTAGNNTGNLSYQWKRGDTNIGTNSNAYTIVQADIGNVLTCEVTSDEQTGAVTSTATVAIAKADGPAAPTGLAGVAPTSAGSSDGKITGTTAAMEYAIDSSFDPPYTCTESVTEQFDGGTTWYVRAKATATHKAGAHASVTIPTYKPEDLTGTATISSTAPKIGDRLIGSLDGGNNTGALTYVWKAGGTQVGIGPEYEVAAADLGKAITLEITSNVETGKVTSTATRAVAKKAAPAAPSGPTLSSKTHNSVTLTPNAAYAFSKDGSTWQISNVFTGLTANTAYTFYQKVAETADTEESAASTSLSVTTDPAPSYTYTVTFMNGSSEHATKTVVSPVTNIDTMPSEPSSGSYTFRGWYTGTNGSGTLFSVSTPVASNMTVYAYWTGGGSSGGSGSGSGSSSGGSGGSSSGNNSTPIIVTPPAPATPNSPTQGEIKVPGTVDNKGNATVNLTNKNVTDVYNKALADAKKKGNEQNGITLVLNVGTGNKTVNHVTVNLPKTAQDTIIAKKIVNTVVVVNNSDIRIGMDLTTMQEINRRANADVNITTTRTDSSKLTGDAKNAIGSRPVFDLKVNYGSGKQVQSFGAGSVLVTIPYTLGANEKAENVQAVYVDDYGKVHWLANSVYDSVEKVLRFSTDHFSTYGIGYKETNATFTDTSGHWTKKDIEFMVNHGLFGGTSATTFSPNTAMTIGMFATALERLATAFGLIAQIER